MAKRNKMEMRIRYDEKRDSYRLETTTDGQEWGLDIECPCVSQDGIQSKDFVSYQFITSITINLKLGYKLVM